LVHSSAPAQPLQLILAFSHPCFATLFAVCILNFDAVAAAVAAVAQVTPGSPAARAGLRPTSRNSAGDLILGDIIQGVDGKAVDSARDLLEQLDAKRVGDKVVVDVLRGGRQRLSFGLQLADRVLGSGTE
jgi:S1-C subfamily serine protease